MAYQVEYQIQQPIRDVLFLPNHASIAPLFAREEVHEDVSVLFLEPDALADRTGSPAVTFSKSPKYIGQGEDKLVQTGPRSGCFNPTRGAPILIGRMFRPAMHRELS